MLIQKTCCVLLFTVAVSAAQRGITAEDYFAFENISDAHIAPVGSRWHTPSPPSISRRIGAIRPFGWFDIDGRSAPRRLTAEGVNSSSPRWSPDGTRLAFLSTRSTGAASTDDPPRAQVWILALAGGEAQVLTPFEEQRERVSMVARRQAAGGGEPQRPQR
jgi:dipeptidyl aminopeptidase/acylaminoacyl peptidase